uniref:Uncharacterized protein n=1 Tax=Anguilla anguilla TaxID=7936 RepID=A0A0E9WK91_ANGAN
MGGSIMFWQCFAGKGTGAQKIDSIMSKEDYLEIRKQHLKTSARKLKFRSLLGLPAGQ